MNTPHRPQLGLMFQFGGPNGYRADTLSRRVDMLRVYGCGHALFNRIAGHAENAPMVIANQWGVLAGVDPFVIANLAVAAHTIPEEVEVAEYTGIKLNLDLFDSTTPHHMETMHWEAAHGLATLRATVRFYDFTGDSDTSERQVSKYGLEPSNLGHDRLQNFKELAATLRPWGIRCGNEMPVRNHDGTLNRAHAIEYPQIATDEGYRNNNGTEWMQSAGESGADLRMMCTDTVTDEQMEMMFRNGGVCYCTERNIQRGAAAYDRVMMGVAV